MPRRRILFAFLASVPQSRQLVKKYALKDHAAFRFAVGKPANESLVASHTIFQFKAWFSDWPEAYHLPMEPSDLFNFHYVAISNQVS